MSILLRLTRSTVGLKLLMALSGAGALVWLLLHMLGNVQVFAGADVVNHYASILKSNPLLLWGERLGFGGAIVVHVLCAWRLDRIKRRARPVRYHGPAHAPRPSTTMRVTGPLIGIFLVFHLLHFTVGSLHPHFSGSDVFRNVELAFATFAPTVAYVAVAMILALHLVHGTRSMLSSVGLEHPASVGPLRRGLAVLAVVICVGLALVPVGAWLGWLGAPR